MKIRIRNFGPIADCELDFAKNLILIIGENNVGKSYAISLCYLVMKAFVRVSRFSISTPSESFAPWIKEMEARGAASQLGDIDYEVTAKVEEHLVAIAQSVLTDTLTESLYGTFGDTANLQSRLSTDPVSINIESAGARIHLGLESTGLVIRKFTTGNRFFVRKVKATRTIKQTGDDIYIYYSEENPKQFSVNYSEVLAALWQAVVGNARELVGEVHFLPASRSGLYQALSAFGQIFAELSKSRSFLSKPIQLPGIAEPLSDYFLKLSNIRAVQIDEENPFTKVARAIEQEILHGEVLYDQKTKRLSFKPSQVDLTLELAATSSMVSEISPIVSYLKHVLPRSESRHFGGKQMIIIEEPEAHLHPANQVRLVGFLVDLVRSSRCKVVLTTHSNYVFNKISNLIIKGDIPRDDFAALLAAANPGGSKMHPLEVSDLGIADTNFVDVGQALFDEKVKLLEKRG